MTIGLKPFVCTDLTFATPSLPCFAPEQNKKIPGALRVHLLCSSEAPIFGALHFNAAPKIARSVVALYWIRNGKKGLFLGVIDADRMKRH
jgi:hypothetical protein